MKTIQRNTEVVSVSLSKDLAKRLDILQKQKGQTKSAIIAAAMDKYIEDEKWKEIYAYGRKIGKKMHITSEDDVDRILHEK